MQSLFLLLFVLWDPIECLIFLEKTSEDPYAEPVLNFRIIGHNQPPAIINHNHQQSHADEVQISFFAFNMIWNLELVVEHEIFSPTTVFRFSDNNGNHQVKIPDHTLYKTKKNEFPKASVNIYDDGTIHAVIIRKGYRYIVDPASQFPRSNLTSKMGIYRESDSRDTVSPLSSRSLLQFGDPRSYPKTTSSIDQGEPISWTKNPDYLCYPSQLVEKKFAIGFGVTYEYFTLIGKTMQGMETHLVNLLADTNTIFVPQMGVHLYIETAEVKIADGPSADAPWNIKQRSSRFVNSGCGNGESPSQLLSKFRTWRREIHPNDAGVWHLLSTCFPPPGVVGLANLDSLCNTREGVGMTSSGTGATWKVLAHEVGHNFGAYHSFELGQEKTGGIMDYGDGQLDGIYQFNSQFRKIQVCDRITKSMAMLGGSAVCWSNYPDPDAAAYDWLDGEQTPCPVSCGTGLLSTPSVCRQCTAGTGPGTSIPCSPASQAIASDSLCPIPKPIPDIDPCPELPPCEAQQPGVDCKLNPNDPSCFRDVDACFVSVKTFKTYCFRGNSYNRYVPGNEIHDDGFPRNIAQYWPGLPNGFAENFDAVIQRNEGRIYIIKGNRYAIYELGFGAHTEPIQNMQTFFGLPPSWVAIDAAVSVDDGSQGGAYIIRGNEYCTFSFDPLRPICSSSVRPITDFSQPNPFPLGGVTAARGYWSENKRNIAGLGLSIDFIYKGEFYRYKMGEGMQQRKYLLEPFGVSSTTQEQSCITGCVDCSGNVEECRICDADFTMKNRRCYPKEYVIELLFDSNTQGRDLTIVKDTSVCYQQTKDCTFNYFNSAEGNTGNAITFKTSDYLTIEEKRLPTTMIDWEFHFWVKLDVNHPDVATNLVSAELSYGSEVYQFSFFLDPKRNFNDNTLVTNTWYPTFKMIRISNGYVSELPSDFAVKRNSWHHLIATLRRGNMELTTDGGVLSIPYDGKGSTAVSDGQRWIFKTFEIGKSELSVAKDYDGVSGLIDQFHVDRLGLEYISGSHSVNYYGLLYLFIAIIPIVIY